MESCENTAVSPLIGFHLLCWLQGTGSRTASRFVAVRTALLSSRPTPLETSPLVTGQSPSTVLLPSPRCRQRFRMWVPSFDRRNRSDTFCEQTESSVAMSPHDL